MVDPSTIFTWCCVRVNQDLSPAVYNQALRWPLIFLWVFTRAPCVSRTRRLPFVTPSKTYCYLRWLPSFVCLLSDCVDVIYLSSLPRHRHVLLPPLCHSLPRHRCLVSVACYCVIAASSSSLASRYCVITASSSLVALAASTMHYQGFTTTHRPIHTIAILNQHAVGYTIPYKFIYLISSYFVELSRGCNDPHLNIPRLF